jgi:redox-sensitive bicupin YhaK (pirin superfamily)
MTELRPIKKVIRSRATIEGAGVHLHRAIGLGDPYEYDPFLLLDDFRSDNPEDYLKGFPWHPHRGIETITYVLKGTVEHGDSTGTSGVIGPGDIQWMTAGSGIFHQEMPKGDKEGSMHGFQLWANLPSGHKMMDPRYRGLTSDQIPEVKRADGVLIKVIAGECDGIRGPIRDVVISPEYLDIFIPAGINFSLATTKGHTVFAYVIGGSAVFCDQSNPYSYDIEGANYFDMNCGKAIGNGNLILFGDGDHITVSTEGSSVRFLLISGAPLHESIAWYGPIVMNTREELETAYKELRKGTFIKNKKK